MLPDSWRRDDKWVPVEGMPFHAWRYLRDVLEEFLTTRRDQFSFLVKLPTGSGKTIYLPYLLHASTQRPVLIVMSDDRIAAQMLQPIECALEKTIGVLKSIDRMTIFPTESYDIYITSAIGVLNLLNIPERRNELREFIVVLDDVHVASQEGRADFDRLVCMMLSCGYSDSPMPMRLCENVVLTSASTLHDEAMNGITFSSGRKIKTINRGEGDLQGLGNIIDIPYAHSVILAHIRLHRDLWELRRLNRLDLLVHNNANARAILEPRYATVVKYITKALESFDQSWLHDVELITSALTSVNGHMPQLVSGFAQSLEMDSAEVVRRLICNCCTNPDPGTGTLLAFLPTIEQAHSLYQTIKTIEGCEETDEKLIVNGYHVLLFDNESGLEFSYLTALELQQERYLVISTGPLENAITVTNLTHVIDCGTCEQTVVDSMGVRLKEIVPIGASRIMQRRGRLARRDERGYYFPVYENTPAPTVLPTLDVLTTARSITMAVYEIGNEGLHEGGVDKTLKRMPHIRLKNIFHNGLMVRPLTVVYNCAIEYLLRNALIKTARNREGQLMVYLTPKGDTAYQFLHIMRMEQALGHCLAVLTGVCRPYDAMLAAIDARTIFYDVDEEDPFLCHKDRDYITGCRRLLRLNAIKMTPKSIRGDRHFEYNAFTGGEECTQQHTTLYAAMKWVVQQTPVMHRKLVSRAFGIGLTGASKTAETLWQIQAARTLNVRTFFQTGLGYEYNFRMLLVVLASFGHIGRVIGISAQRVATIRFYSSNPASPDEWNTCVTKSLCDNDAPWDMDDWVVIHWMTKKKDGSYVAGLTSKISSKALAVFAVLSPAIEHALNLLDPNMELDHVRNMINHVSKLNPNCPLNEVKKLPLREEWRQQLHNQPRVKTFLELFEDMVFTKTLSNKPNARTKFYTHYIHKADDALFSVLFKVLHDRSVDHESLTGQELCDLRYSVFATNFVCFGCCPRCLTGGHKMPSCGELGKCTLTIRMALLNNHFFHCQEGGPFSHNNNPHKMNMTKALLSAKIGDPLDLNRVAATPFHVAGAIEPEEDYISSCECTQVFFNSSNPTHTWPFTRLECAHLTDVEFAHFRNMFTRPRVTLGRCPLNELRSRCPRCLNPDCDYKNKPGKEGEDRCNIKDEYCALLVRCLMRATDELHCTICNLFNHETRDHDSVVAYCKHEVELELRVEAIWRECKRRKPFAFWRTPDFEQRSLEWKLQHMYPPKDVAFEYPPSFVVFDPLPSGLKYRD